MVATVLAAGALAAHPCRAALPRGPAVPAPVVLWTSCGSFRLGTDGQVSRLPRHWLARHGGGTGRRYGARIDIRRTRPGRFVLLAGGRVIWRSARLYPRDGGDVAFGPHAFAFASYRRGIFLTDLRGRERLVVRGRGLYPYSFTGDGDLIVTGSRVIRLVSPNGITLRTFAYRPRNAFGFDEETDTLYFVTPQGRLVATHGTHVELERRLPQVDGTLTVARPHVLVFSGDRSITVTRRDGSIVAETRWRRLSSDAGVSVSPDGRTFAFRLSDGRSAAVYLLQAGSTQPRAIFRHRTGPTGCAAGANLSWHGHELLYRSSDGTTAVLDAQTGAATNLTRLAGRLPGTSAYAAWRSDFRR